MLPSTKILHGTSTPSEKISILLVTPFPEDLASLRKILQHHDWQIMRAESVRDAATCLERTAPALVVCERDLPDGSWKDLLQQSLSCDSNPLLLVISRHADESLWGEVLNLGAYDVLLKPFDCSEVTRVFGMAWRHWGRSGRQSKPARSEAARVARIQYA